MNLVVMEGRVSWIEMETLFASVRRDSQGVSVKVRETMKLKLKLYVFYIDPAWACIIYQLSAALYNVSKFPAEKSSIQPWINSISVSLVTKQCLLPLPASNFPSPAGTCQYQFYTLVWWGNDRFIPCPRILSALTEVRVEPGSLGYKPDALPTKSLLNWGSK